MTALNALSDPQALPQALACVGELEQLLEQEFNAVMGSARDHLLKRDEALGNAARVQRIRAVLE